MQNTFPMSSQHLEFGHAGVLPDHHTILWVAVGRNKLFMILVPCQRGHLDVDPVVSVGVKKILTAKPLTCERASMVSVHWPVYKFQNLIFLSFDPPPVARTLDFHGHQDTA